VIRHGNILPTVKCVAFIDSRYVVPPLKKAWPDLDNLTDDYRLLFPRPKRLGVTPETRSALMEWYWDHKEDYRQVRERLRACRNVVESGPLANAAEMLRSSCQFAILSIQTARERHERAFTMLKAGDVSIDKAAAETVYHAKKARWLHALELSDAPRAAVKAWREADTSVDGQRAALDVLVERVKGLSWVKAAFALALVGATSLACPDSRTKDVCEIESRIRTRQQYFGAVGQIRRCVPVDAPTFVRQWVAYDYADGEHARHLPFYREILSY
jgi:thermostable 8-oxoguanine DNA glycosylase